MATITLEIDPDTAKLYQEFIPQRQQQIQVIFNYLFKRTLGRISWSHAHA